MQNCMVLLGGFNSSISRAAPHWPLQELEGNALPQLALKVTAPLSKLATTVRPLIGATFQITSGMILAAFSCSFSLHGRAASGLG